MWILFISAVVLLAGRQTDAQSQMTQCTQKFGQGLQSCFQDKTGVQQQLAFSILSNGSTGPLPPGANKQALTQQLCGSFARLQACLQQLTNSPDPSCQQSEVGANAGTVNSILASTQAVCGIAAQPSQCLQSFENSFTQCLTKIQLNPGIFRQLLTDPSKLPPNVNAAQIKQQVCSDTTQGSLMQCASNIANTLQAECSPADTLKVGQTLQGMLEQYQFICTGKSASQCRNNYATGMNACAQKHYSMGMQRLMTSMNTTMPAGPQRTNMERQICPKLKDFEGCAKEVITKAGCPVTQLIPVEVDLANVIMKFASFCHDNSIPGICLLTLQKQFGACYGKVGLNAATYLGNKTDPDHKGALIGHNRQEAELYCSKKHDLFTCMTEVIRKCPGAEQTLSMTGFDIHGMERAVGVLCLDIEDYIEGLECFATPTEEAVACMNSMTVAITELSGKQLTGGKPSMDMFFTDFCRARVRHVGCDAQAWPSCNPKAVKLKNEFECQLIPMKCHNAHKDDIDTICPHTDMNAVPQGDTKIHQHEHDLCAQNIKATMNQCFAQYGLEHDMFLVNITHDRGNFLGDDDTARTICQSRTSVFECMRTALRDCPAANDILAFWGHQQSKLETAVSVLCDELDVYSRGLTCLAGTANIQQCIGNTENQMTALARQLQAKEMSPEAYFRRFCAIRMEHLQCDLRGWGSGCAADVMGMKTEFECLLIQDHCRNLQVQNYKTVCNTRNFAKTARKSGGAGNAGGNSAPSTSASGLALLSGVAMSLFALFL